MRGAPPAGRQGSSHGSVAEFPAPRSACRHVDAISTARRVKASPMPAHGSPAHTIVNASRMRRCNPIQADENETIKIA